MQISGNFLPVTSSPKSLPSTQDKLRPEPVEAIQRYQDKQQPNHQATAEYVFRGELLEETVSEHRKQAGSQQQIDPSNIVAINRYIDTGTLSDHDIGRQGRLVDIYI